MSLKINGTIKAQQKILAKYGFLINLKNVPIAMERIHNFALQKLCNQINVEKFENIFDCRKNTKNLFLIQEIFTDHLYTEINEIFLEKYKEQIYMFLEDLFSQKDFPIEKVFEYMITEVFCFMVSQKKSTLLNLFMDISKENIFQQNKIVDSNLKFYLRKVNDIYINYFYNLYFEKIIVKYLLVFHKKNQIIYSVNNVASTILISSYIKNNIFSEEVLTLKIEDLFGLVQFNKETICNKSSYSRISEELRTWIFKQFDHSFLVFKNEFKKIMIEKYCSK